MMLGRKDSRGNIAIAPTLHFQIPAARCTVGSRAGYYAVALQLDMGRPAHDAFVQKIRDIEDAISALDTHDLVKVNRLITPDYRLFMSVRDDTEWFDEQGSNVRGSLTTFPVHFTGVSTLVDVCKVWTSKVDPGVWGIRINVLQAKQDAPDRLQSAQPLFLDDE